MLKSKKAIGIDYDGFLSEILRLVARHESGIVRVLRGVENPVITIGILKGKITAASCGSVRGLPALEKIREMKSGMLHVQHIKFRSMDKDLPGTEEILFLLGSSGHYRKKVLTDKVDAEVAGEGIQLHEEVSSILGGLVGPSITPKIDAIANRFPPHSAPIDYLSQCQRLVEIILGKGSAKTIFAPFFARYRS